MCLGSSRSTPQPEQNPLLLYNNGNVFDPIEQEQPATDTSSTVNNKKSDNKNSVQPDFVMKQPTNNSQLAAQMQAGLNRTYAVPRAKYKIKKLFK
jgi:hypothetical protein